MKSKEGEKMKQVKVTLTFEAEVEDYIPLENIHDKLMYDAPCRFRAVVYDYEDDDRQWLVDFDLTQIQSNCGPDEKVTFGKVEYR